MNTERATMGAEDNLHKDHVVVVIDDAAAAAAKMTMCEEDHHPNDMLVIDYVASKFLGFSVWCATYVILYAVGVVIIYWDWDDGHRVAVIMSVIPPLLISCLLIYLVHTMSVKLIDSCLIKPNPVVVLSEMIQNLTIGQYVGGRYLLILICYLLHMIALAWILSDTTWGGSPWDHMNLRDRCYFSLCYISLLVPTVHLYWICLYMEGIIYIHFKNIKQVQPLQDRKKDKVRQGKSKSQEPILDTATIGSTTYTFEELEAATKNFRQKFPLGKGGFGCVYKGRFESTGKVVAVKQLYRENRKSLLGRTEFLNEVQILSSFSHTNLVNLIGYCAKGDQRFLVYESMPLGSLKDHLHDLPPNKEALDWNTRMKIAAGVAKGLEYLHDTVNAPVISRDFKSSSILLGEGFHPKLSDFGLTELGPVGDKTRVSTRVMGTYGYCAPEYAMKGQLTLKSEVYSWGVVFLELITGRKAIDNTRAQGDQSLVAWARPLFKDHKGFPKMADPLLQGRFPVKDLGQALALAALCLLEQPTSRPTIRDVVKVFPSFAPQTYDLNAVQNKGDR